MKVDIKLSSELDAVLRAGARAARRTVTAEVHVLLEEVLGKKVVRASASVTALQSRGQLGKGVYVCDACGAKGVSNDHACGDA